MSTLMKPDQDATNHVSDSRARSDWLFVCVGLITLVAVLLSAVALIAL